MQGNGHSWAILELWDCNVLHLLNITVGNLRCQEMKRKNINRVSTSVDEMSTSSRRERRQSSEDWSVDECWRDASWDLIILKKWPLLLLGPSLHESKLFLNFPFQSLTWCFSRESGRFSCRSQAAGHQGEARVDGRRRQGDGRRCQSLSSPALLAFLWTKEMQTD